MEGNALQSKHKGGTVTVILLGGLPASGKSTLARQLLQAYNNNGRVTKFRAVHLEYDEFEDLTVAQKPDDDRREAWNHARNIAVRQLEATLGERFLEKDNESQPLLVLMDDNYHLRGMRKQIHRLLLNHKPINFGLIWMRTGLETCIDRNGQRERRVSDCVLEKMNAAIEPPRAAWETYWLPVDNGTPLANIMAFVESCPEIVDLPETVDVKQKEIDRQKTIQTQSHNWDMTLRSWVGKVAKYDKTLAKAANEARKSVIAMVKDPNTNITEGDLASAFADCLISNKESISRDSLLKILC